MADPSPTTISTLEVAVKTSATDALKSLDKLADKCGQMADVMNNAVKTGKGLATVGENGAKGLKRISDAANDAGKKIDDLSKKATSAQEQIKKAWASGLVGSKATKKDEQAFETVSKAAETASHKAQRSFGDLSKQATSAQMQIKKAWASGLTGGGSSKTSTTGDLLPKKNEIVAVTSSLSAMGDKIAESFGKKTIDQALTDKLKEPQKLLPAIIGKDYTKVVGESVQPMKEISARSKDIMAATEESAKEMEKFVGGLKEAARSEAELSKGARRPGGSMSREAMEYRYKSGEYRRPGMSAESNSEPSADRKPMRASDLPNKGRVSVAEVNGTAQAASEATKEVEQLSSAFEKSEAKFARFMGVLGKVGNAVKNVLVASFKFGVASMKLLASAAQGLINDFKRMPKMFLSAAKGVASFGKALAHPIASIKQLLGLDKKQGSGILGGLLGNKSLGKYIGLIALRRAVTSAIRAITAGIKEGFENIRQYSAEINSDMYSVQNSLLYVKNAWAAAFAPIVQVVKPYVNAFLDIIASALNAIGRLMAMLTGKGFAVQAVKMSDAMYEAGSGAEKAASGTNKATKAAEEYKKTIMGFDQLHVLNAPDESSGSGGSGSGGSGGNSKSGLDVKDMFTTVSLEGMLKDAIDAGNWREVGKIFADNINSVFQKAYDAVQWDKVSGKVKTVVGAITTTFNSLVSNVKFDLIGRTFGAGINTITNTINLLYNGINWKTLGTQLANGFNGLVDEVNWTNVGELFVQKFNALWTTGGAFLKGLNYENIGTALANAINGGAKKISLATVGTAISDAISGLTITLTTFTLKTDWATIKDKIVSFVNGLFSKIKASDIINAGTSIVDAVLGTFSSAIGSKSVQQKFTSFSTDFGTTLAGLKWGESLGTFASTITTTLKNTVVTAFTNFCKSNGFGNLGTQLGTAINTAMSSGFSLGDVGKMISNALSGIAVTLKNLTLTIDWDEVEQQMEDFLGELFQGDGISGIVTSATKLIGKFLNALTEAITSTKGQVALAKFGNQLGESLSNVGDWMIYLGKVAAAIFTALTTLLDGMLNGLMKGLLKKAGLSDAEVEQYYRPTSEFEAYAATGDPRYLPQTSVPVTGEMTEVDDRVPSNQRTVDDVTAVETKARDEIPQSQKTVDDSTAVLRSSKDEIQADTKTLGKYKALVTQNEDKIPKNDKTFKSYGALMETNTDKIPKKDKSFKSYGAVVESNSDKIPKKDKTFKSYGALIEGNTDKVPEKDKTFGGYTGDVSSLTVSAPKKIVDVAGQIVEVYKPGVRPTIDIDADIRNVMYNGNRVVRQAKGGIFSNGSWKPITRYASGGSPQSAELFMAREAGPELVGRIGSRTAVVNNTQIVSSVAAGVRQAVAEAMSAVNAGGSSLPYEINVTVRTQNDEVLARAVERGTARRKYRLGTAMG